MPPLKVSLHYLFTNAGGLTRTCNEELSHGLLQFAAKCQPLSWIAARPHTTPTALFAPSFLTFKTLPFLNLSSIYPNPLFFLILLHIRRDQSVTGDPGRYMTFYSQFLF